MAVAELLRKQGISHLTFLSLEAKVRRDCRAREAALEGVGARDGVAQADVRRSSVEARGDQGCLDPKTVTRSARRAVVTILTQEHALPVQRARAIARCSRTAFYRAQTVAKVPTQADSAAPIITALQAIVAQHGRWGFWKCFDRLRALGHA